MKFVPHLILVAFFLILVFQVITANPNTTVSVSFEVKDAAGNPLPDALVIIQRTFPNTDFSENEITDSNGRVSFNLNQYEVFGYIVYKLSYNEETGGFDTFTTGNQNIPVVLEKLPDDQWYFYRINNGEMEFQFSSPDDDTNYIPGEYIKTVLEVRNVGATNIKLLQDRAVFQIVDGQTLNNLRVWGDFIGSGSSDLGEIILNKDGWIKVTISTLESAEKIEVCGGKVVITYKGIKIVVPGNEPVCVTETQDANKIPPWILKNNYKFNVEYFYEIEGQERSLGFTSQEFFIDSTEWKPEIVSTPTTNLTAGTGWTYQPILKEYDANYAEVVSLIDYKLVVAPEGMIIDNNTGLTQWTPINNGDYNVTVRAYYEYFENDTEKIAFFDQEFTLVVTGGDEPNNLPLVTSDPITKVDENTEYNYDVDATDADGDILTYSMTGPGWLSINASTGLLTGTAPDVSADTPFDVTIVVDDGNNGTATQTYTLIVANVVSPPPNTVPVITSTPITTVDENTVYSYDADATDAEGNTLTYSMSGPLWLNINSSTGMVSGTAPEVNANTDYDVIVTVSDGIDSVNQSYLLTVVNIVPPPPVNNAPIIISTPVTSVNENQAYSYDVDATDADGDALTYSMTQAPSWLSINSATGLISGTAPDVSADTPFDVTVVVDDGNNGTATQTYILTVANVVSPPPVNNIPIITSTPIIIVNENQTYAYNVDAIDADGDTLIYSISGPSWLSINSINGFISGAAPTVNADTDVSITITVSDGQATATQAYALTVNDVYSGTGNRGKTGGGTGVRLITDNFDEEQYINQFGLPQIIIEENIPKTMTQNRLPSKIELNEKILALGTIPILIFINLILTAIIFLIKPLINSR